MFPHGKNFLKSAVFYTSMVDYAEICTAILTHTLLYGVFKHDSTSN